MNRGFICLALKYVKISSHTDRILPPEFKCFAGGYSMDTSGNREGKMK